MVLLGLVFLVRWFILRRNRGARTQEEKFTRLTRDVASDISRSTSSSKVEEVGRGSIGLGDSGRPARWDATESSSYPFPLTDTDSIAPRFEQAVVDGEAKRVKSIQHSKCDSEKCDAESVYSTDNTDKEIAANCAADSKDIRAQTELGRHYTDNDNGSRSSSGEWSSRASTIEQRYGRGGRSFDIRGSNEFGLEQLPEVDTNPFEDAHDMWRPYRR